MFNQFNQLLFIDISIDSVTINSIENNLVITISVFMLMAVLQLLDVDDHGYKEVTFLVLTKQLFPRLTQLFRSVGRSVCLAVGLWVTGLLLPIRTDICFIFVFMENRHSIKEGY